MGDYGSDNGELRYPKGLAISPQEHIIVADSGNNRVVMFSKTGQFMTILLGMDDNIDRPIDIACSSSGLLGVAMPDRHEVFVYQLNQTFRQ
jgi:tripartite motif-containing protein 71